MLESEKKREEEAYLLLLIQRQHTLILTQHRPLNRNFPEKRLHVRCTLSSLLLPLLNPSLSTPLHQPQNRSNPLIKDMPLDLVSPRIKLEQLAPKPRRPRHLDIQPGIDRVGGTIRPPPITHNEPLESPFPPQHLSQQGRILATPNPIHAIIPRHHGPRICLLDSNLKWESINLPQRPFRNNSMHGIPPILLVIAHKMLQRSNHTGALDPFYKGGGT